MEIKDSGTRREFNTGAVRDIQEGKGRCDLMPLDVVAYLYQENKDINGIFTRLEQYKNTGEPVYLLRLIENYVRSINSTISNELLEVSKHFEEGAKKYGENNWQKGIPTNCYIDSAVRHYLKYLRGDKDEPHDRAFVWNIICCIWTCVNKPKLNVYLKENTNESNTNSAN